MKIAHFVFLLIGPFAIADDIYHEGAVAVCKGLSSSSYVDKCMAQIKKKTYNDKALGFCSGQKYWNKISDCLKLIENKHFDNTAFGICTAGKYFNNLQKNCLRKISDKTFESEIELEVCKKKKYDSKKISCVTSATMKPYDGTVTEIPDETLPQVTREEITSKVKKAYALLRDNKNTDATLVLHDLIKELEKKKD